MGVAIPETAAPVTEDAPAADAFDAEFEAAREADADPLVADAPGETGEAPAAEPPADVNKRLADTQAALKKERAERRQLADRLAAVEATVKPAAQPVADIGKMPDPNVDPIGALEFVRKIVEGNEAAAQKQRDAQAQQQRSNEALKLVQTTMAEYEEDFRQQNPDYDKAADHFIKARKDELAETGLEGKALDNAVRTDLTNVVSRAIRAQKDPAEVVYKLAKNRGFGVDNSASKLQTIAKGQAAAKSVGTGGTGAGGGSLTYGAVSNLKGAAFDAAFAKLRAQERA